MSSDVTKRSPFLTVDAQFAQLRRLTEVSRALTYTTSLEQVTSLTARKSAELLGAHSAVLMLLNAEGLLHVRASFGISESLIERFSAPLNDEVIGRLQGLLAVPDESFLAVPLVVGGAVTGLVAVGLHDATTPADEALLSALADQAAVAIDNARLGGEVRIELESRLRSSEDQTTAKDLALSTLAHDVRTPLGAIDGYCEILEAEMLGPINDRQREMLGRVRMSGRHLLSLLDNVMEMARISAGVLHITAAPVRLIDVVRDAMQMLIPAADAKLQTLQLAKTVNVIVNADEAYLRQVLVNIIGNAVKFTPQDGAISITIVEGVDGNEPFGEIRVTDSGPGIAEAERTAVFEPYYRSQATAKLPGVGLGLAISHAIMVQMGGSLHVEGSIGEGSTFVVRLPKH